MFRQVIQILSEESADPQPVVDCCA